jgi:uncharacterized protein
MTITRSVLLVTVICLALPARAETLLTFSDTGTVTTNPDELDATLQASATSPTVEGAQFDVNRIMTQALTMSQQTSGVRVETGNYATWHPWHPMSNAPKQSEFGVWHASQNLVLRSGNGPKLLELVGNLQKPGLAVERLEWRLSDKTQHIAHDEAMQNALKDIRVRADKIAREMGLHFVAYRSITIAEQPVYPPHPFATMAMQTPPVAQAGPITTSVRVVAEVVLDAPPP